MTDPIEAMARAIEHELHVEDGWEVGTPQLRAMCNDFAITAYNALRESLEPVGWLYTHPDDPFPPSVTSQRHDPGDFYLMAKRGWTETPCYTIPEIDQ